MTDLNSAEPGLVCGAPPGFSQEVISEVQFPAHESIILCISVLAIFSCQFLFMVAVSSMVMSFIAEDVFSSLVSVFTSSFFLSLLQAVKRKEAASSVRNVFFIQ